MTNTRFMWKFNWLQRWRIQYRLNNNSESWYWGRSLSPWPHRYITAGRARLLHTIVMSPSLGVAFAVLDRRRFGLYWRHCREKVESVDTSGVPLPCFTDRLAYGLFTGAPTMTLFYSWLVSTTNMWIFLALLLAFIIIILSLIMWQTPLFDANDSAFFIEIEMLIYIRRTRV
jgi:hypothetical protein